MSRFVLTEPKWGEELLIYLNNLASSLPYSHRLVQLVADGPIFLYPLFLIYRYAIQGYGDQNAKKNSLTTFFTTIFAFILHRACKPFIDKSRPEVALSGGDGLIIDNIPDISFPSGHASVSAGFAFSLLYLGYKNKQRRMICRGRIFVCISFIMSVARIGGGIHRPTDILAGRVVGLISVIFMSIPLVHNFLDQKIYPYLFKIQKTIFPFIK